MKQPMDFKVGEIYKMSATSHSHVTLPYYVEIIKVSSSFIVTNIPGQHSLEINQSSNWQYHIPRMTYIGMKDECGHLLLNQYLI